MTECKPLPTRIHSIEQSRALDRALADELGIGSFELMQRAARAVHAELETHWPEPGQLLILCGAGNNAGDGALVGLEAIRHGWQVTLMTPLPTPVGAGDAARAFQAFREAGGEIEAFVDAPIQADLIVDALFGTGLNRAVSGAPARAMARINEAAARGSDVLSVDIPSGIDAATGKIWGDAVRATLTVTFICLKMGLLTGAGRAHRGRLAFHGLGASEALYARHCCQAYRTTGEGLHQALPRRKRDAHKGNHGRVACIGGDQGMGGAIRMTAEAALRAGAGLVNVACHETHAGAMSQARPELMCQGLPDDADARHELESLVGNASVVAIGPGLGRTSWGRACWQATLAADGPMVVDADALHWLSREDQPRRRVIMTPHPGEAAQLLACSVAQIQDDRPWAVRTLARRYQAVVVLKGAGTLIADEKRLWVCTQGNPGMATGGMGDLLTGVIAALASQGLPLWQAAVHGVCLHALAGDQAAAAGGERGLLPMDLLPCIRYWANPHQ